MRKYIKNIKVGDYVKSLNFKTGELEKHKVESTFSGESDHYYIINKKIKVTGAHPFFANGRWTKVEDLSTGDMLLDAKGKSVKIKSISKVDSPITIFNMEVEGTHNYFAGGFLVHNKGNKWYGSDKWAKKMRNSINAKATEYNDTVYAAYGGAIDEIAAEGIEFEKTTANAEQIIDEGFSPDMELSGLAVEYKSQIDDLNTAFGDTQQTNAQTLQDQRAELQVASENSGLVTAGEVVRAKEEILVENAESAGENQQDRAIGREVALNEFKTSVNDAKGDFTSAASEHIATAMTEVDIGVDTLNTYWKNAIKGGNKARRKNVNDSTPDGEKIRSKDGASSDNIDDALITDYDLGKGPENPGIDETHDMSDKDGLVSGMQRIKDESVFMPTRDVQDRTLITGAFDKSLHGKTMSDAFSTGNAYMHGRRCFSGDTWIEVYNG